MRAGGPRVATSHQALYGVYYAIVTQNKDPENKCRVKVRLPWLDQGGQDQTQWASVAVPMAGAEYGWYTIPDVEDVVAVMFIAGDVTRPVVLGGVWSKTDPPPEKNEGANDFRGFKSRSGARIVMDDSSNGKVYLSDKTDKNAVVVGSFQPGGSGGNSRAAATPPEVISGSPQSGVSIASMEGELQITSKGKVKIEAQSVEIIAKTNADFCSKVAVTFEGAIVNCNAGGTAKLEGSMTQVN